MRPSVFAACLLALAAYASPAIQPLPPFSSQDRVLVLAPHEDDESLGAGGAIQQAEACGADVRVVFLTNGDHNEWAFLLYRKRPWVSPRINRQMGELRQREAAAAARCLGLSEKHLVFLGFPDDGTLRIWEEHWGESPPFYSRLVKANAVFYRTSPVLNRPYKGEEIILALERQILQFQPTRIFVTHPLDANPDHRAYFLFLQVALRELEGRIKPPEVYLYPIHMGRWPRPFGYHPELRLTVPKILTEPPAPWWTLDLNPGQTRHKCDAIRSHKSQMADHGYWLVAFARQNELYTQIPATTLVATGALQVQTVQRPAVPSPETTAYEQEGPVGHVAGAAFHASSGSLTAVVAIKNVLEEEAGISMYAFGYRRDVSFAAMPKLHLRWRLGGLRVFDQGRIIRDSGIAVERDGQEIRFLIPWAGLRYPEEVFVQVKGLIGGIPVSQTGWHILTRPRKSHPIAQSSGSFDGKPAVTSPLRGDPPHSWRGLA